MPHLKKIICFLFLISFTVFSQEKMTISGTVYDKASNETLIGVSIYFPDINIGTTTNEYGFYSVTLPKGTYRIQLSSLGYFSINKTIDLEGELSQNFNLSEEAESLDEIIIEANIENLNVRTPQMSVNKLTSATIKQIPVVLGESDIIKSLILSETANFSSETFEKPKLLANSSDSFFCSIYQGAVL